MKLALTSPVGGYYTSKSGEQVFGSTGDFVTSPEISQMFGEIVMIWYIALWEMMKCPGNIEIVELGPGKGTLMSDMLRTAKRFKRFGDKIKKVHMIEASEELKNNQKVKLLAGDHTTNTSKYGDYEINWYSNIDELQLSEGSTAFFIAHEFFDALPIHRFELTSSGWAEIMVDINSNKEAKDSNIVDVNRLDSVVTTYSASDLSKKAAQDKADDMEFRFVKTKNPTLNSTAYLTDSIYKTKFEVGDSIEVSPESASTAQKIAKLIDSHNGAGLVIDYGQDWTQGSTFRGISNHRFVHPLSNPGKIDLTADVDFLYLRKNIAPFAKTFGPIEQQEFLHSMGIQERLKQLVQLAANDEKLQHSLVESYKRLTGSMAMGKIYKFMAIVNKNVAEKPVPF
ncbi:NADH dehydrogenase [ubiquinone] complex I, assembly factor 7 [Zancudomyces culisetae]|uniref:Protein arginine methyltransferase NDUFAF7 n=1 Tax=Zancudomyces culisetae TaxID=1213189 RepID=A0A1R1PMV1_ZANCU|nr:NADH dehydrogenase [ubiquinone] complex I, assembly factor 7 [Zancudomyces culisetae]OMH83224.1 NADH dehydrogenase [ubiquinone] complex I, assembly factor 7 [Zancudomyces culisetae]|eukprot:OMH82300.1 NADH dehydrogenase [ubiquinone] complex I, assembly factor 7 [Zancudomyces culisetae]